MAKKFFVTTPIYYANGLPHIWHANSSFIADFYARWKRLRGYEVKFSTWLDENGQKMVEKAESEWKSVKEWLDYVAEESIKTWNELQISFSDFIRTSDEDHHKFVQDVMMRIYTSSSFWMEGKARNEESLLNQDSSLCSEWQEGGNEPDFYLWKYIGLYCVGCEAFKNLRDLTPDGLCSDHLTKPEEISEENWFFNLKKYEKFLKNLHIENPGFVEPEHRYNEVKAFVNGGLENFSISRENKHNWIWIELPRDSEMVVYVRFDALFNYLTVCYRNGEAGKFWDDETEILHILGKDIVKFHATYRPAMLESAGFRQPNKEFVTGYLTVDGQKMSKTLWNVLDPVQIANDYDRDALVFYLLYDVAIGLDWDFSRDRFKGTREKMLIWGWGNLVNRVVSLGKKYGVKQWKINNEKLREFFGDNGDLREFMGVLQDKYLNKANTKQFVEDWYKCVQLANEYITKAEPRKKYRVDTTRQEAIEDLEFLLWIIKQLGLLSAPLLVNGFVKLQKILGNEEIAKLDSQKNSLNQDFVSIFERKEFEVNLEPEIIYEKKGE